MEPIAERVFVNILNPLMRFLRLPCGTIVAGPMPGSAGFQPAKRNPAGKMPALPGMRAGGNHADKAIA